ncbi:unnamed protein product, partial [Prorocentrum cordatum]
SPHRGARDAHAALLSLRAGPRSSTLQTAKTLEGLSASELSASGVFRLSSAAPAARAAAAVQCERAGGARRRLERAGAQKPKACWAVRGGDEAGGEGERNRRRDSGVESLRPSAASSAVPGENQGGGASSASWQRSQPARAPERTGGEGGARGGRKEEDAGCCWLARPPNKKGAAASGQAFPHSSS